jgi:hypothetical protein
VTTFKNFSTKDGWDNKKEFATETRFLFYITLFYEQQTHEVFYLMGLGNILLL